MSRRPASGERRERGACFVSPSVIFFRPTLFIIIYTLRSDNGLRRLAGPWAGWAPCSAPRAAQCRDAHVRGTAVVGKEVTYRRRRSRAPQYSHPSPTFFSLSPESGQTAVPVGARGPAEQRGGVVTETQPPLTRRRRLSAFLYRRQPERRLVAYLPRIHVSPQRRAPP